MVLLFLQSAYRRIRYPYVLEWIEEGNLQEVARYVHHLPVYIAPSIEYTANIYAPLYFWVSSWFARWMGVSFASMRIVSFISTLGLLCGMAALVWQELPRKSAARALSTVFAVGLFLSLYPISTAFFDLGRVDMLCMFFTVFALLAGRRDQPILAGLLWILAFHTKQGMLPVALLALCYQWQQPRRVFIGLFTFGAGAGASVAWLAYIQPFWYWRMVFRTAGNFPFIPRQISGLLPQDLFEPLGIAILILLASVLLTPPNWRSTTVSFYGFSAVGMVFFSCYLRVHGGASNNAMIPAWVWISIVSAIGFGRLYSFLQRRSFTPGLVLLLGAAVIQLVSHVYNPGTYVPPASEAKLRRDFLDQIRSIPGDVLIFDHPQYSVLAGKRPYAAGEVVETILVSKNKQDGERVQAEFAAKIHQRVFTAIAIDMNSEDAWAQHWIPGDFLRYYPVRVVATGGERRELTPQPLFIYFPCPSRTTPDPRQLLPQALIDDSLCH